LRAGLVHCLDLPFNLCQGGDQRGSARRMIGSLREDILALQIEFLSLTRSFCAPHVGLTPRFLAYTTVAGGDRRLLQGT